MSNPEYQPVSAAAPPSPITPAAGPDSRGTASYNIQADLDEAAISAAYDAAGAVSGAGIVYTVGDRQSQTETLLSSPAGFSAGSGTSGWDITAGFSGGGGDSWPNDIQPGILETPVQGMGDYPANTGTD